MLVQCFVIRNRDPSTPLYGNLERKHHFNIKNPLRIYENTIRVFEMKKKNKSTVHAWFIRTQS